MQIDKSKLKEHIRQFCFNEIKESGDKRRKIVDFEVDIEEESDYSDNGYGLGGISHVRSFDAIKIRCVTETLKKKIRAKESVWI